MFEPKEVIDLETAKRRFDEAARKYEKMVDDLCGGVNPYSRGESDPSWKDTNPKFFHGDKKLGMSCIPSSGIAMAAHGFLEGALKYGRYNWRISGVRVSTYYDAVLRHLQKYWEGQWADPVTRVPHLSSALACIMIIIDADRCGKLNDDRPPSSPHHDVWLDAQSDLVEHLKEVFKDKSPQQYTIADTQTVAFNAEESCPSK